jgi:putative radical SAM enzyme (TIGR03279 family)
MRADAKNAEGLIARVNPESTAARLGLRAGDAVLAVNGHAVRDVIDFQFFAAEEEIELKFRRNQTEKEISIQRRYGEPFGIEFAHPTFDVDIRRCNNKCAFCFVTQSPRNMRPTVYIKDDDYRYSFLFGHYVTLTNLKEGDWARIQQQHLSPLYVSIHATDHKLRKELLGNPAAPDILEQLAWFRDHGLTVHAQLVLVPGINDGEMLDKSIEDLWQFHPTVVSVSIVPVGLTRYRKPGLHGYNGDEASRILRQLEPYRRRFKKEAGIRFVYPSDEWYLLAIRPFPSTRAYDRFELVENGVGMVRQFLDDWRNLQKKGFDKPEIRRATMVCGTLIAPIMREYLAEFNQQTGSDIQCVPIENKWYGNVSVSGLLTAADVIEQLKDRDIGEMLLLPRVMFDNSGQVTLDGLTPQAIAARLHCLLGVAQLPSQMLRALNKEMKADEELAVKPGWWGEQNRPFWQAMGETF